MSTQQTRGFLNKIEPQDKVLLIGARTLMLESLSNSYRKLACGLRSLARSCARNNHFAYVSVSCASDGAHVYTNNAHSLVENLSRLSGKTSALKFGTIIRYQRLRDLLAAFRDSVDVILRHWAKVGRVFVHCFSAHEIDRSVR